MHSRLLAFAVVVALTSTAHAELPADGVLVAAQAGAYSSDDSTLTIYRVKPTGMAKVHESKNKFSRKLAWTDATTLWTLGEDDSSQVVQKIVDGKVAETIQVSAADWKLKSISDEAGALLVTTRGQIWLEQCVRQTSDDDGDKCLAKAFLRVDAKPFTRSKKRPKNVRKFTPLAFPRAKAPAGYSMKLGKVAVNGKKRAGATCTGPTASATFPDATDDEGFTMKPSKVTWLRSSPAVVRIEGDAINPIGLRDHQEAFYIGCKRVRDANHFGHGLWGTYMQLEHGGTPVGEWTLYNEDKIIGTVAAEELEVAPR